MECLFWQHEKEVCHIDQMNEFMLSRAGIEWGRWKDAVERDLAAKIRLLLNHFSALSAASGTCDLVRLRALNIV